MNPTAAAEATLELLWPDRGFPVDPVTIARKLGLEVLEADLPDEISGALFKEKGKDPVIMVHRHDSTNRKRFTCAHELGHYVARAESADDAREYDYIDFRNQESSNGNHSEEVFANQFAASLLMPENALRKIHGKVLNHIEMARYFGVSAEAIKYRLKNLNLLKDA
jgi:Zn-dependent peptidase ImmA (M78 family)